jgi:energy-coupling factor transporter ATP-binding protein EcfA2
MIEDLVIQTEDLSKRFGNDKLAVDGLGLCVRRGQVFGFLGPNGAGKTTTLKMLLGLIRPTPGRARVAGFPPGHRKGLSKVGALVEAPAFYPYLSGWSNLRLVARYCGAEDTRCDTAQSEGEVSLARSRPRSADEYRQVLDRVAEETAALHSPVDDLLWLARFESEPGRPATEAVQLADAAQEAGARFTGLAEHSGLELVVVIEQPAQVEAPGPWIDRLLGVLLANACTYTPAGGQVQLTVGAGAEGPGLIVDDSGPGIPPEERARIFDRFHRSSTRGEGAGLGLSIGDAIVRATGGVWQVTTSPLGGARFQVRWPRAQPRRFRDRLRIRSSA